MNKTAKLYGATVTIMKHECVGHVLKCVGKCLRSIKLVSAH